MSKKQKDRLKYYSYKLNFSYLLNFKFPKLILGKSAVHGSGILTRENIKKGQAVCPCFGVLYEIKTAKIKYPKFSYQISDNVAIETVNEPGFFNHSCQPNAFINNSWIFTAIRDIKKGEEILVDYGTVDYFGYKFKCNCKEDNCRKLFNGKISANREYQKKMLKYFSPYLKNKFGK